MKWSALVSVLPSFIQGVGLVLCMGDDNPFTNFCRSGATEILVKIAPFSSVLVVVFLIAYFFMWQKTEGTYHFITSILLLIFLSFLLFYIF